MIQISLFIDLDMEVRKLEKRHATKDKQPIRELMALTSDKCRVRKLLVNYRSSKEIVEFNNKI